MGFIDKILDKFRLDDDYEEDDFLDEEDEDNEDFEDDKPKTRFFDRFRHDDDEEEDAPDLSDGSAKKTDTSSSARPNPFASSYTPDEDYEPRVKVQKKQEKPKRKTRITPSKRRGEDSMHLRIIIPKSFEETQDIADSLLNGSAVVINLDGLDYMLAQRIVDFSCGACYALDGHVQQPSRNLLILAPENVDISGDAESLLDGNFDIPNMIKSY
ncbi:MAG: cell division protein SepF [Lachnospiraceae bacterium]|nr:cell division protein SepF [Lachnospiraceae bacterium]